MPERVPDPPARDTMIDRGRDGLLRLVHRAGWLLGHALVGAVVVAAVLAATAVALGIGYLAGGDPAGASLAIRQTLVQAPAALALTAVAAALVGAVPRAAVPAAWAGYAVAVVVGLFGGLLRLPDDVVRFSPVGSVPVLPTGDWAPTAVMTGAAVLLVAGGVLAVRGRDLAA